jgi:hypothetical protein
MAGRSASGKPVTATTGNRAGLAPDALEFSSRYASMRGRGLWFIGAFDLFLAIATLCLVVKLNGSLLGSVAVFVIVSAVSLVLLIVLQSLVLFVRLGDALMPTLKKRCRDYLLRK